MSGTSTAAAVSKHQVFDFTKRKRWADLLINELTEAAILILSPECSVLFCNPGITELLGWKEEELVDANWLDLINVNDKRAFTSSIEESIRTRNDLLSYVRMKCKPPQYPLMAEQQSPPTEKLIEFKGHPHFIPEQDGTDACKCFFAVAKQYPGRNAAALNTFFDLKMQNERLQQRLNYLRACAPISAHTLPELITQPDPSTIASSSSTYFQHPSDDVSAAYYPSLMQGYDPALLAPRRASLDSGIAIGQYEADGRNRYALAGEDDSEDSVRKKKIKKMHQSEQYVCVKCGRTDSPEWRKGPLGPKTLCNACGLRWAKQVRKDEVVDNNSEGSQTQPSQSSTP